jgi:hypothetical protein
VPRRLADESQTWQILDDGRSGCFDPKTRIS